MMRHTFSTFLAAAVLAAPAVAAGQAPSPAGDRHVRVQSAPRVVERQRERVRPARRGDQAEQTERVSHTFRIGGSGELHVSNLSGDITITRGGGSEVQVEAIKTARARTDEEAREMLPNVRIDFAERAGRAEVKVLYPREHFRQSRRNVNVSVAYRITAPEGTRISAKSLSGSIRVTGIKGELSLGSTSGNVEVVEGARLASASSTSGNVEIRGLRSEMPVELRSISGNVIVRQSRVSRLELNTVSGNLIIAGVQAERVEAQSLSGDVEFTSPLDKNGRYELSSHSGNIRIVLSEGTGFELDANSFSGTVRSAVELRERTTGSGGSGRGGPPRRLRGIYGDGSALLDITTFSGNVIISK